MREWSGEASATCRLLISAFLPFCDRFRTDQQCPASAERAISKSRCVLCAAAETECLIPIPVSLYLWAIPRERESRARLPFGS